MLVKDYPSDDDLRTEAAFTAEAPALQAAFARLGIPLSSVYGTTAVRCSTRTAVGDEYRACSPHLLVEIESVLPRVIVAFGDGAVEGLQALDKRCGLSVPDEVPRGTSVPLRANLALIATEPLPRGVMEPESKRRLWRDLRLLPGLLGA